MDFKTINKQLSVSETMLDTSIEQAVDCEITLPDFCPDILRVLKCCMTPRINSSQIVGNRLTVEGSVQVKLIYTDEQSLSIHCYDQSVPFTRAVEISGDAMDPCVNIRVNVEYVNCRAVNPRRADIHGAFMLHVKITQKREENILTHVEEKSVQLRKKFLEYDNAIVDADRAFAINEVLEISQNKPPVRYILRCSAVPVMQEYKLIQNKILVKGELHLCILYCAESADNRIEKTEHSLPISQILDVQGITEDSSCDISTNVASLDVQPKNDSGGDMTLLEMGARISLQIMGYEKQSVELITDAYSTECELITDQRLGCFETRCDKIDDTCMCKGEIEAPQGVLKIFDIWCSDVTACASQHEGALTVSGTASVCVLYIDENEQPALLERILDYSYKKESQEYLEPVKCSPSVQVRSADYSISGSRALDVRIELEIRSSVTVCKNEMMITEISPDSEKTKEGSTAALIIYYAENGELIWNIARKYNTSVEAIISENELEGEVVEEKRMLLIPGIG